MVNGVVLGEFLYKESLFNFCKSERNIVYVISMCFEDLLSGIMSFRSVNVLTIFSCGWDFLNLEINVV